MRKKPTVAQKTYCPGKKRTMRGLEISNGEMSHLHYDHCNGIEMPLELVPVEEIIITIVPELVQTVLESIMIKGNGTFEIWFLDGTAFEIKF